MLYVSLTSYNGSILKKNKTYPYEISPSRLSGGFRSLKAIRIILFPFVLLVGHMDDEPSTTLFTLHQVWYNSAPTWYFIMTPDNLAGNN